MNEHLIHVTDPIGQRLHNVQGEEWILLNDPVKPRFVNFRKARRLAGNYSCAALGMVDECHFANNAASGRTLDYTVADHHVHRAVQKHIHCIGVIANFEKDLVGRQSHRVGLVGK